MVPEPDVVAGVPGGGGVVGRLPEGALDRLREEHLARGVRVVHAHVEPAVLRDGKYKPQLKVEAILIEYTN